jgi:hypothetical protein
MSITGPIESKTSEKKLNPKEKEEMSHPAKNYPLG